MKYLTVYLFMFTDMDLSTVYNSKNVYIQNVYVI